MFFIIASVFVLAVGVSSLMRTRAENRLKKRMTEFAREIIEDWTSGAKVWRVFGEFKDGKWYLHLVHDQTHMLATVDPGDVVTISDADPYHTAEFGQVWHHASTDGREDEIRFGGAFRISGPDGMLGLRPWGDHWKPSRTQLGTTQTA